MNDVQAHAYFLTSRRKFLQNITSDELLIP